MDDLNRIPSIYGKPAWMIYDIWFTTLPILSVCDGPYHLPPLAMLPAPLPRSKGTANTLPFLIRSARGVGVIGTYAEALDKPKSYHHICAEILYFVPLYYHCDWLISPFQWPQEGVFIPFCSMVKR